MTPRSGALRKRVALFLKTWRSLGSIQMIGFKLRQYRQRLSRSERPYLLCSKQAEYPLWCRPGTSDAVVFHQVFVETQYACVDVPETIEVIVDGGANVGYTSAYFLTRFPNARVIAIEPDPSNFSLLLRNLLPYEDRAIAIHAAVWSHDTDLRLVQGTSARGSEWGRQVTEDPPLTQPMIEGISVPQVLRLIREDRIGLLKLDIEGAERQVFGKYYERWLGRVDNIVIELHGDPARRAFLRAVSGFKPIRLNDSGELTICCLRES